MFFFFGSSRRLLTMTTAMAAANYTSTITPLRSLDVPPDAAQRTAHHVRDKHGNTIRFRNPHPSAGETKSVWGMTSAFLSERLSGNLTAPDISQVKIPSVKPAFPSTRAVSLTEGGPLRATWLGHACYLVEFPSGLRVLFDPVFEHRCSPLSFLGPARYTAPGCALGELPEVDAVVISHSHYDHLSHPSVVELAEKNPHAHFFVGLGLEKWFRASGIDRVTEMDWWEDVELVLTRKGNGEGPESMAAMVSCLPSQHSSGRTGRDKDHTLWASWAVASGGKSVWFGGDTGYRVVPRLPTGVDDYGKEYENLPRCPDFAQIGARRGPFDLGLIPIAAYTPRFLLSSVHANPFDAVEIFKDTKCKRAMAIHWGTWMLTVEHPEEPPRLLKEALKRSGLPETGLFDTCAVGESREF